MRPLKISLKMIKMTDFIFKYWLQIGFSLLITIFSYLYSMVKKWIVRQSVLEDATRAYLKHKIIETYHHSMEKGSISIEEFECVVDLFKSYKSLGGNGTCERIYNDFQKIKIQ